MCYNEIYTIQQVTVEAKRPVSYCCGHPRYIVVGPACCLIFYLILCRTPSSLFHEYRGVVLPCSSTELVVDSYLVSLAYSSSSSS